MDAEQKSHLAVAIFDEIAVLLQGAGSPCWLDNTEDHAMLVECYELAVADAVACR